MYQLVRDLLKLPSLNRLSIARDLELHFIDYDSLDVFSEDEAGYNYSLLRKRDAHTEEPYDDQILEMLFTKSKRTVEVLSECLLLSKNDDDIVD